MGEGKSSVIMLIVAAELANGSQLARVIVAKPQSKQIVQMLTSKLGGLLDRRIYHMPFSRSLRISSTAIVESIEKTIREYIDASSVLLVQLKHLLSFQLIGLECYYSKSAVNESRNIVNKSDENFSVKFELVYTMGSQRPIELSPARWICTQQVLDLVRSWTPDVARQLPQSIDVSPRNDGGFPRVRILKSDAGKLLMYRVARHICDNGLDGLPIARQQEQVREAVFKYLTQHSLSQEEISAVERPGKGAVWTGSTKSLLYGIR
ncbi:hypothetical protein F4778DRAFT_800374 [Xylariomycetidae sp. FL2044]|nr:hypothetical protein F4778DRAFT_800374 [Xylariomycetidae sp. FL2044]